MSVEKLTSRISNFFKSFDTFGESHSFKVKSHKGYVSSWGGIVSIIFFTYSIIYFSKTLNIYLSGNFTNLEIIKKNYPNITLNTNNIPNFHIGFCLRKSDYQAEDFLYQNLNFYLNYDKRIFSNKTLERTSEEINLENCDVKKSSEKKVFYQKQLENLEIENCKCIDFSKSNYTLKNFEENLEKNFFSLTLKIKENLTEAIKAQIFDYIKNNNPQLSLFFPDIRYNGNNKNDIKNINDSNFNDVESDSSIELILKMKDFYLDYSATKIVDLYFGMTKFEDFTKYYQEDRNGKINSNKIILLILFKFIKYKLENSNNLFLSNEKELKLNTLKDDKLFEINISLSNEVIIYKKFQILITSFLGNILSYLWNIFIITYLIMNFYNKFGSKRNITEKLFIFNKEIKKSLRNIVKDFVKSSNKTRRGSKVKKKGSILRNSSIIPNKLLIENLKGVKNFKFDYNDNHNDNHNHNFNYNINNNIDNSNENEIDNHYSIDKEKFHLDLIEKISKKNLANLNEKKDIKNNNNENDKNNNNENDNENYNDNDININNIEDKKEPLIIENKIEKHDSFIFGINKKDIPYYNYNKNEYHIYFISYLFGKICQKLNCCRSRISKTLDLHDSTCSFYDYYMDINTYLKMMIEFDILKAIVLGKRKSGLLRKFRPIITKKYNVIYKEKLEDFYVENFTNNDINKIKRGMEVFSNERDINAISTFAKYI
jgi:hypothetical protein